MLFNTYEFIWGFLPIAVIGFYLLGAWRLERLALAWLIAASLFFYGWWNPVYLWLITCSIVANFSIGQFLTRIHLGPGLRRGLVIGGVAVNLASIGYFKYANFFVDNINQIAGAGFHLEPIILPLAISFFTFQQITYLVDAYRGLTKEYSFLHYCLFVTFFPQLIAGPIVHHHEMMPQFMRDSVFRFKIDRVAIGATIFFIGLFKKVIIADSMASYGSPIFAAAEAGTHLSFFEAWSGALAYTFQLYFDFSGYSDMAIGLARLFGIRLPLNFFSPYKATSIIDFWRRWHMTLSRFLRDYVYFSLGGNKKGPSRRHINLMITMLLGGLWHGAGWTFVVWGGLHGLYLVVNHAWRRVYGWTGMRPGAFGVLGPICAWTTTFMSVVVAWVFFRAESLEGAVLMLSGMVGLNGIVLPSFIETNLGGLAAALMRYGVEFRSEMDYWDTELFAAFAVLLLVILALPNTYQLMERYKPAITAGLPGARPSRVKLQWRATTGWAVGAGITAAICFAFMTQVSEFLYFQF